MHDVALGIPIAVLIIYAYAVVRMLGKRNQAVDIDFSLPPNNGPTHKQVDLYETMGPDEKQMQTSGSNEVTPISA